MKAFCFPLDPGVEWAGCCPGMGLVVCEGWEKMVKMVAILRLGLQDGFKNHGARLIVVAKACNPSTWEAVARSDHPWL